MSVEEEKRVRKFEDEHEYEGPGHAFWPSHVFNQMIILYLVGGVLITLAILVPFHLEGKADPMVTPDGVKPEWYFLAAYQFLKYVPKTLGVALLGLAALGTITWPFLDQLLTARFGMRAFRKIGTLAVVLMLLFTLIGVISERTVSMMGQQYEIDLLGIPHKITATRQSASPQGSQDSPPAAGSPDQNSGEGSAQ